MGILTRPPKDFCSYTQFLFLWGKELCLVNAFMTRKNLTRSFSRPLFLSASFELHPAPDVVVTDFEKGAMNAKKTVLGEDMQTKACFFHLRHSTWRKVQELELVNCYRADYSFRTFVGMLIALAFLPVDDVEDGTQLLCALMPSVASDLTEYFHSTYVSGSFRCLTRFPRNKWNVHPATVEDGHRTNNNCGAWNRRFSSLVGHSHPSVWKATEVVRCEVS